MNKKQFFIYRYYNKKNEVIYVGLTARPIKRRVKEHECEKLQEETYYIEYAEVSTKADMQMYEIFYINKHQPKYNIRSLDKEGTFMDLPELSFIPFLKDGEKTEIELAGDVDRRNYQVKTKSGMISVMVDNPYERDTEKRKLHIKVSGEIYCSFEEIEKIINACIQAANDVSDDIHMELHKEKTGISSFL